MSERKGCSQVVLIMVVVALCVGLGISMLVNIVMAFAVGGSSSMEIAGTDYPENDKPKFEEIWSEGSAVGTKVVRIDVHGPIMRSGTGGLFGESIDMVADTLRQIRAARNDSDVAGIILDVNSPGGGITASDEIWHALQLFRDSRKDRKILAFYRDTAASGAYYISMATDYIMAEPTSIVGSVGVIMQTLNWRDLSETLGIKDVTIKSGANKDLLNPFQEINSEQKALLQELIDASYMRFFELICDNRGISAADLKPLADGRVFTSAMALKHDLIDAVGYWDEAIPAMGDLLGKEDLKIIRYQAPRSFIETLLSAESPLDPSALLEMKRPRLEYRWNP